MLKFIYFFRKNTKMVFGANSCCYLTRFHQQGKVARRSSRVERLQKLDNPDLVTRYRKTSRSDPKLVALDGAALQLRKPDFLSLKRDHFWCYARTDGRTDAHTWIFRPLYTISPSGNNAREMNRKNWLILVTVSFLKVEFCLNRRFRLFEIPK